MPRGNKTGPTDTEVKDAMTAEVTALEQRIVRLRHEIDAIDARGTSPG